jgi:probable HAF family extracellular repeat protein
MEQRPTNTVSSCSGLASATQLAEDSFTVDLGTLQELRFMMNRYLSPLFRPYATLAISCLLSATPLHGDSFTLTYLDLGYGNGSASYINSSGQVAGTATTGSGAQDPFLYSAGQVYDLGSLGGTYGFVYSLNSSGQVAGGSYNAGNVNPVAFVTTGGPTGGSMIDLSTLDGTGSLAGYSIAQSVNNAGQVMGSTGNNPTNGFLYSGGTVTLFGPASPLYMNASGQVTGYIGSSPNDLFLYSGGTLTNLGDLGAVGINSLVGINSSGEIAGTLQMDYNSTYNGFLYDGSSMLNLGTLGGTNTAVNGINDSGVVVGYSELTGDAQSDAVTYSDGTLTDIGNLGGMFASAFGINDAGQIFGTSTTAAGNYNGFLYENGQMTDIGTLGGDNTYVQYMNGAGDIIGTSQTAGDASTDPFFYDASTGQMTDLEPLFTGGFPNVQVSGLNDAGDIIGTAYDSGYDNSEGFILAPSEEGPIDTPEPGSLLLLGTGLSGLSAWLRKKRNVAGTLSA